VLVWSADRFVDGASAIAATLKVSPFVIGVIIVGFGTSAPELVVSVTSAIDGAPGLARSTSIVLALSAASSKPSPRVGPPLWPTASAPPTAMASGSAPHGPVNEP